VPYRNPDNGLERETEKLTTFLKKSLILLHLAGSENKGGGRETKGAKLHRFCARTMGKEKERNVEA